MMNFGSGKSKLLNAITLGKSKLLNDIRTTQHSGTDMIKGSGVEKSVMVYPNPFDYLCVMGSMSVAFVFSDRHSIELIADDNLVDLIGLSYTGNTLNIGFKPNINVSSSLPIKVNIHYPALRGATLLGSGNLIIERLAQDDFNVIAQGSGSVRLNGTVKYAVLSLSGSGDIDAVALRADHVDAKLKGSGCIKATAVLIVKARLSGSGNIKVHGDPSIKDEKCTGSGEIIFKP